MFNNKPTLNSIMFEANEGRSPRFLSIAKPPIGNKCFLVKERGMFVLESGPGSIRAMACTHAGSGGIVIYDGIPDKNGMFEDHPPEELFKVDLYASEEERAKALLSWSQNKNGKEIYYAHPAVLGMWQIDGGCQHGITLISSGELSNAPPIITVVWQSWEDPAEKVRKMQAMQAQRIEETIRIQKEIDIQARYVDQMT